MHVRYLIVLTLFTALFMAVSLQLTSLRFKDFPLLAKLMVSADHIVLFGNSVNNHVSKCDLDSQVLSSMYSKALDGEPVVDISRGGMKLGEMLYLAEIYSNFGKNTIYIPISPVNGFFNSSSDPVGSRSYIFTNFGWVLSFFKKISKNIPVSEPIEYLGKRYGTYNEFSKTHFAKEKFLMSCPETIGNDREFLKFMYWRNFLQPSSPLDGFEEFKERVVRLKSSGVKIVIWISPIDYDDLNDLHGNSAVIALRERTRIVRNQIESLDIPFVDLSEKVRAEGFADRWCACGHLNEIGRQETANSMAVFTMEQRAAEFGSKGH